MKGKEIIPKIQKLQVSHSNVSRVTKINAHQPIQTLNTHSGSLLNYVFQLKQ